MRRAVARFALAVAVASLSALAGWGVAWGLVRAFGDGEEGERRQRVADYYADALAQALWRYDISGLRSQMSGILLHEDIIGVRVDGDGGGVALLVGAPPDGGGQDDIDRLTVLRRPLAIAEAGGQSIIGVASFVFSDPHRSLRDAVFLTGVAAGLLSCFVVSFAGLAVYAFWIKRPVRRVRALMTATGGGSDAGHLGDHLADLEAFIRAMLAELRQAQTATASASAAAAEAGRVQAAFLANVSHELRTPLNGVIGLLTLLMEQPLNALQYEYVRTALSSAENLSALVGNLLDVTQLEAGKTPVKIVDADVRALVADVETLMRPRAKQRNNDLHCQVMAEVPPVLRLDEEKFRQVLLNLLGNAVKFTENGDIAITVSIVLSADNAPMLRLTVADTGVGIPAEQKERLFQRFAQADETATRAYEGSGLGLAICRELCRLLGGRIGVDSQVGVGSVFWVEIPVEAPALPRAAPAPLLPPLRILVVGDLVLNRALLCEMLRAHGHQTIEADGGAAAVKLVAEGDACHAVLMDAEMTGVDGCEAARRIRALPFPMNSLPVVLVASDVGPASTRRFTEAGVDRWVAKPVGWREIAAALVNARGAAATRVAARSFS